MLTGDRWLTTLWRIGPCGAVPHLPLALHAPIHVLLAQAPHLQTQTSKCSARSARRGAMAAIVVYDITSTDSFTRAKAWVRELQRQGNPNMIIALAGGCMR